MPAGTAQQPTDRHLYLGFVSVGPNTLQAPHRLMRPGTLCMLQNLTDGPQPVPDGEKSIGMVLEVSGNTLSTSGARLVLALYLQKKLKEDFAKKPTEAIVGHVNISFRPSSKQAELMLASLEYFRGPMVAQSAAVALLQTKVLHQPYRIQQTVHSIRYGPHPPAGNDQVKRMALDNVYAQTLAGLFTASRFASQTPDAEELRLLNTMPGQISDHSQLPKVDLTCPTFRSVIATILAAKVVGHSIIVCVEDLQDRASVAYQLHQMLKEGKQATAKSPELLDNVKFLVWTRSNIPYKAPEAGGVNPEDLPWSDPRSKFRLQGGLFFKFMVDDSPIANWLLDPANQQAPPLAPPPNQVLLDWSMAHKKQQYLKESSRFDAGQYFTGRAQGCNGVKLTAARLQEIAKLTQEIERRVLARTDILVTNFDTAMSEEVQKGFCMKPLLFLMGTDRVGFDKAGGVMVALKEHTAAFICGNPDDKRHGQTRLVSGGKNEAKPTYGKASGSC